MEALQGSRPEDGPAIAPHRSANATLLVVALITALTLALGLAAASTFTTRQMYLIEPLLAGAAVFVVFTCLLASRVRGSLVGDIGFIYVAFALAYTVLPGLTFLLLDFNVPTGVDPQSLSVIFPQPVELGAHLWRHALFITGVSAGYLALRGSAPPPLEQPSVRGHGSIIAIMAAVIVFCIATVTLLSAPVTSYIEHYTRFDHLSWPLRRLVYICLSLKKGGYFVLLALMFSQYRRYRVRIAVVVLSLCIYESAYSLGSRIETFTILLASVGFYHFRVAPISVVKGAIYLAALAVLFSGAEYFRASNYNLRDAEYALAAREGGKQALEFSAVFNTSFQLYSDRARGALPPRPWPMFFNEFIAVIPFLDHTAYNPQYWYARNYFPEAEVPPQTMGVIADSALWGGELDLLVRSLINGALFGYLMRWFLCRRHKWWALTVYTFCYATCIMTLKYSVLYQLIPFTQVLLPTLLFTGVLFGSQGLLSTLTRMPPGASQPA
jgi:hypothetical protein